MAASDLTSIPLPQESNSKVGTKKTAREMLQEALRDHKHPSSHCSKDANTASKHVANKLATALGPKIKMSTKSSKSESGESSQSIVDELFKDFIAQKFSSSSKDKAVEIETKTDPANGNSVDELNKILDMEICSIQSQTGAKEPAKSDSRTRSSSDNESKSYKRSRSKSSSSSSKHKKKRSSKTDLKVSDARIEEERKEEKEHSHSILNNDGSSASQLSQSNSSNTESHKTALSGAESENISQLAPTKIAAQTTPEVNDSSNNSAVIASVSADTSSHSNESVPKSNDGTSVKPNIMLPAPLAKRLVPPKLLGVKLSTESLSLIKSTDRIDRDGRVWEEGEVHSSHSEDSDKGNEESSSEPDGYPSETGSVDSKAEDWKSHSSKRKKKHKHKHKKKKKKSSKEKDKDKHKDTKEKDRERRHDSKDREKDRDRDKDKLKDKKHDEKFKDRKRSLSKDEKGNKSKRSSKDKEKESREKKEGNYGNKSDGDRSRRDKDKHDSRDKSSERDKDGDTSHHRGKDRDKKRKGSRSRSKSPKRHKKSRSKSPDHRADSPRRHSHSSAGRSHYSEWDARRYSDDPSKFPSSERSRSRSKSKERSSSRHNRHGDRRGSHDGDRSKERHERDLHLQIDKAKLRKIAIAKALQNMKAGQGPQVDLASVKSGGKSVEELTEFCKKISEKSKGRLGSDYSDSSDEEVVQQSDEEDTLIHHPFKVRDTSSSNIVMNIRNAKQLPVLTPSEKQAQQAALRIAFPVSSGSHHRASESEWVPVAKTTAQPTTSTGSGPIMAQAAIEAPPEEPKKPDNIFPDPGEAQKIDIGSIISERLQAVRKLQENPYDVQALTKMHHVQEQASKWATSKHLPGQFLGSTGAHVLSQEELIGDRKHQAWAKKTQLSQAAPVNGGIGMFLLQKMGWKQGEGLGKNNEGNKEPLLLDIKIDRKGLTTSTELNSRQKAQVVTVPRAKDLSNKHPVSALMELCNRRRWGPPVFTVVSESGPDHKKNFLFKVKVNNVEYQPCVLSSNKKTAKAQCAAVCLREMGLIPRDAPLNI